MVGEEFANLLVQRCKERVTPYLKHTHKRSPSPQVLKQRRDHISKAVVLCTINIRRRAHLVMTTADTHAWMRTCGLKRCVDMHVMPLCAMCCLMQQHGTQTKRTSNVSRAGATSGMRRNSCSDWSWLCCRSRTRSALTSVRPKPQSYMTWGVNFFILGFETCFAPGT